MNQERIFTVLREPHITEKVSVQGELANQYAFKVAPDATKMEIRAAVENIFNVSVTKSPPPTSKVSCVAQCAVCHAKRIGKKHTSL